MITLEVLKNLYDASPFGFAYHKVVYGTNGTPEDYVFLYVNPAFEELTGLLSKNVLNLPVTKVLPTIRSGEFDWVDFYGKVVLEGRQEIFEQYSQPLRRWYKVHAYPINTDHFATTFLDITEEKRPGDVLENVLNTIPDMISVHDAEMNILFSNWSGFGNIPKEKRALGTKCYRTYRGYEGICPDCQAKKVLQTREIFQTEVKLPDGTWADLRVVPVLNETGDCVCFAEWVRVITDRKEMELELQKKNQELNASYKKLEAMNEEMISLNDELESSNRQLQASEAKWSTLFHSMTEHVVLHELVFDPHGRPVNYRITGCNRRFMEITGINEEQAVGKLATEVYGTAKPPLS